VLKKHGHDVVATLDGAEAWEAMQRPGRADDRDPRLV